MSTIKDFLRGNPATKYETLRNVNYVVHASSTVTFDPFLSEFNLRISFVMDDRNETLGLEEGEFVVLEYKIPKTHTYSKSFAIEEFGKSDFDIEVPFTEESLTGDDSIDVSVRLSIQKLGESKEKARYIIGKGGEFTKIEPQKETAVVVVDSKISEFHAKIASCKSIADKGEENW